MSIYSIIVFHSGTPGSGKSYNIAKKIWMALRTTKRTVISTVNVDIDYIRGRRREIGEFIYIPITDLKPKWLIEFAARHHKRGIEGQTLLVIDECQILFNPRDFSRVDRPEWILFLTRHRHLGYDIIMSSQFDRLVDRQIRSLFEIELRHRKINNYKWLFLLPITIFAIVEIWYGMKGMATGRQFVIFQKKYARIYDSYVMWDDMVAEALGGANEAPTPPPPPHGTGGEVGDTGGPTDHQPRGSWLSPSFDNIRDLERS